MHAFPSTTYSIRPPEINGWYCAEAPFPFWSPFPKLFTSFFSACKQSLIMMSINYMPVSEGDSRESRLELKQWMKETLAFCFYKRRMFLWVATFLKNVNKFFLIWEEAAIIITNHICERLITSVVQEFHQRDKRNSRNFMLMLIKFQVNRWYSLS